MLERLNKCTHHLSPGVHIQPRSEVSSTITPTLDRLWEVGERPERNSQKTNAHTGQVPVDQLGSSPSRTASKACGGNTTQKQGLGPQGTDINKQGNTLWFPLNCFNFQRPSETRSEILLQINHFYPRGVAGCAYSSSTLKA